MTIDEISRYHTDAAFFLNLGRYDLDFLALVTDRKFVSRHKRAALLGVDFDFENARRFPRPVRRYLDRLVATFDV